METERPAPWCCCRGWKGLLPIREAYEWKPRYTIGISLVRSACFQFVKRMNGNNLHSRSKLTHLLLASNSWSVWMETSNPLSSSLCSSRAKYLASNSWSVWMETVSPTHTTTPNEKRKNNLLPIREAYEWKLCSTWLFVARALWLASNSWSVWMETGKGQIVLLWETKPLLPIREAYEWKQCVGLTHELTLQFF